MKVTYRFLYRLYRLFSGARRWAERRFTRTGLVVFGAMFVAAILGFDPENSVGYQAFTLLVGLMFVAVLGGWRFKAAFAAERFFRGCRRFDQFAIGGKHRRRPMIVPVVVEV